MSIWKTHIDIKTITDSRINTIIDLMGIEFIEVGDDFLSARMPVDHRTHQPLGIMHGGASCVLAETLGSIAGNYSVDAKKQFCVGLDIFTSHIRMVKTGYVIGTAKPVHIGKKNHVWEIRIIDEEKRLVSLTRLTLAVLDKRD